jgi:hypothetical protein
MFGINVRKFVAVCFDCGKVFGSDDVGVESVGDHRDKPSDSRQLNRFIPHVQRIREDGDGDRG